MSGWDWINAGLSVLTYSKAYQVGRSFNELNQVAEVGLIKKQLLDEMRNFIFDISRDMQLILKQIDESPQQVNIVSRVIKYRLKESGLSPEIFSDIQDKEYFFSVENQLNDLVIESKNRLKQEEILAADKAVGYIFDLLILNPGIEAKEAKEYLKKTVDIWDELNKKKKWNKSFLGLGISGVVINSLLSCPLILFLLSILYSSNTSMLVVGILMLVGSLAIWVGSIVLLIFGLRKVPDWETLKSQREAENSKLLAFTGKKQLIEKFGDLSSSQYRVIFERELVFVESLLGKNFDKVLKPKN